MFDLEVYRVSDRWLLARFRGTYLYRLQNDIEFPLEIKVAWYHSVLVQREMEFSLWGS
jgi:hypothetical protein